MNFLKNILDPNYKFFYKLYRKLPVILSLTIAAFWFIASLILVFDDILYFTDLYLVDLILSWIIGAVCVGIVWFFSLLVVSPTIIRTDSVIEINEKLNAKDNDN